jgi:hypothetical protein
MIAKLSSNVNSGIPNIPGLSLQSIRDDPRIGKQTFILTSVNQSDPDSSLFELPRI